MFLPSSPDLKRRFLFPRLFAAMLLPVCLFSAPTVFAQGQGGAAQEAPDVSAVSGHETAHGPRSVADLAERLIPAVVNISTRSLVDAKEALPLPRVPEGSPFQEFFEDFFEQDGEDGIRKRAVQSLGSGFIIDASGLIVTNNHVILDADKISVKLADGNTLDAEIIGRDSKTDLALLKVDAGYDLPTVAFGLEKDVRVGDWVMAIGNPFGLGGSVSVGIVSARNRDINTGPYDSFIQTDAAINRGNSGGPLFDMWGNVVGINTAIISPTGSSIGLGFAIPSRIAAKIIKQLRDFGETRRGWLGIRIQQVSEDLAEGLGMSETGGALVAWVNDDGPAQKAGIKAGDVIIRYGDVPVEDMRDLTRAVADTDVGRTVAVTLVRKGQEMVVPVEVGLLEENERTMPITPSAPLSDAARLYGMELSGLTSAERKKHNLGDTVEGVVVEAVEPGSAAEAKGIAQGMVIVEVEQEIVSTPNDVTERLARARAEGKASAVLLLARPDGGEMVFVPLPLSGDGEAPAKDPADDTVDAPVDDTAATAQ